MLCFTAITVFTGHYHLGSANLPIALLIATIKATLVVLFFMHMTEAPGANRLVFVVSLVFTIVLLAGVFGDLLTRQPDVAAADRADPRILRSLTPRS